MNETMTATERLLRAKELVESVMAGLDLGLVECPCPEHVRHYNNWSDAQTHIRLQAIADRLGREAYNDSVSDLSDREEREQAALALARDRIRREGRWTDADEAMLVGTFKDLGLPPPPRPE